MPVKQTIQADMLQKRGTQLDWEETTLILLPGQMGYATDTGVLKIGDGEHLWKDLSNITSGDNSGISLPSGGSKDQALIKASNANGDVKWGTITPGSSLPNGGTTNQVLTKNSNANGDVKWSTPDSSSSEITNITNSISTINDSITTITTDIEELEEKVTNLESEDVEINSKLENVVENIVEIEENITALDDKISNLKHEDLDDVLGIEENEAWHLSRTSYDYVIERMSKIPERPVNHYPNNEETDVYQFPEFIGSPYKHIENTPLYAVHIKIATDETMETIVYDNIIISGSVNIDVPDFYLNIIQTNTTYYWQIRYQDDDTKFSLWSNVTSFTTKSVFYDVVIKQPSLIYPGENANVGSANPLLISSNFDTIGGSDTHESTDWQIANLSTFSQESILFESLEDSDNLNNIITDINITAPVNARVRYKGAVAQEKSPWSSIRMFKPRFTYTNPLIGIGFKLNNLGLLFGHWIDANGNDISIDPNYFENNPMYSLPDANISVTYTRGAEGSISSAIQEMVAIPPIYVKVQTNHNAEVGEDMYRYWICPEGSQPDDSYYLHPAFRASSGPIYWGKYLAGSGSSNKIFDFNDIINSNKEFYHSNNNVTQAIVCITRLNTDTNTDHKGWHIETVYDSALRYLMGVIYNRTFDLHNIYTQGSIDERYKVSNSTSYLTSFMKKVFNPFLDANTTFSKWEIGYHALATPAATSTNNYPAKYELGLPENPSVLVQADDGITIGSVYNSPTVYISKWTSKYENNLNFDLDLLFLPGEYNETIQSGVNILYKASMNTTNAVNAYTRTSNSINTGYSTYVLPGMKQPSDSTPSAIMARACKWTV
jgi:hypothetical protein